MASVNTLGNYYSLSSLLSSSSGSSTSQTPSLTGVQALVQDLDAADSASSQNGASSYLLDLSPQAQQLMNGTATAASSGSGSGSSIVLTQAQQTTLDSIIEKYKNAPIDQETFDAIQNALQAAGLSPQTLGAENQVQSFNPTHALLDALNGNYSDIQNLSTSASTEQSKEANYMQSVVSLWKSEDASTSSTSGSATPATTGA